MAMADAPVTEHCADLTVDDAVTRARTASPVESWPIQSDADYLRSDGQYILDILSNARPVFNVVAPRRWGKTSFLLRAKRHAEARKRRVVVAAFNSGVESVISALATFFDTEAQVDAIGAAVRALHAHEAERPIVLLDEGVRQIDAPTAEGDKMRSLLAQLAAAARDGRITLCHAEIPQFFARCEDHGDGLDRPSDLVAQNPILLGPVEDSVRQAFLGPVVEAGHGHLVSEVGSIPGEIQSLRFELSRLKKPDDTESLRNGFETSWARVLETVSQNLAPEELAVLWSACQPTFPSRDDLSKGGGVVQRRLEAWGLVRSMPGRKFTASSAATRDLLKDQIPAPTDTVLQRVFVGDSTNGPERRPPLSNIPEPTFEKGFIIHQISDLHFGQFSEEIGGKWLCEYYIEHLKILDPSKRPHAIIICGDLTSFGLDSEFVDAARFVQQLKGSAGRNGSALLQPLYVGSEPDCAKQIVVVPGNHDVTWREQRRDGDAAIKPFQKFLDITQVLTPLSSCPAVHFEPVSVTILACNSAHLGGVDVPSDYVSLPPELRMEHGPALAAVLRDIRQTVEENATARMDTLDPSSRENALKDIIRFTWGYVEPRSLEKIKEYVTEAEDSPDIKFPNGVSRFKPEPNIRIGVLHHNVSAFGDGSLFADLINSGRVVESFLKNNVNMLLHGHQHQFNLTGETVYTPLDGGEDDNEDEYVTRRTLHCIGADSLGAPGKRRHGAFNQIVIFPESSYENARKVEIKRVELPVDDERAVFHKPREMGRAELHIHST